MFIDLTFDFWEYLRISFEIEWSRRCSTTVDILKSQSYRDSA